MYQKVRIHFKVFRPAQYYKNRVTKKGKSLTFFSQKNIFRLLWLVQLYTWTNLFMSWPWKLCKDKSLLFLPSLLLFRIIYAFLAFLIRKLLLQLSPSFNFFSDQVQCTQGRHSRYSKLQALKSQIREFWARNAALSSLTTIFFYESFRSHLAIKTQKCKKS